MKKLDKDLLVKRLTEMVEKGEEFVTLSKNIKTDFIEFEDEIIELFEEKDAILIDIQNRIDNIVSFIEGDDN